MPNRRDFLASSTVTASLFMGIGRIRQELKQSVQVSQSDQTAIDFAKLADEYSLGDGVKYLNHASIGCIAKSVQDAHVEYLKLCETNPWLHMWSDAWKQPVEDTREAAAKLMGCDADQMAITHNTTEAFNLFANGLPLEAGDEILCSNLCHSGAYLPFKFRADWGQFKMRRFDFPMQNISDMTVDKVVSIHEQQIRPETRVLLIPHLDNTLGIRHPIKQLSEMARSKGVEFVGVDAAQTPGMIPMRCKESTADMIATSGHKWIGGPKGTGLAFLSDKLQQKLKPMWMTWGQNSWQDSVRKFEDYGTRNLPEVLTLHDAIDFLKRISIDKRVSRLRELREFAKRLVTKTETLSWESPNEWEVGGSLFSIRTQRPVGQLAKDLFEKQGMVFRPFSNMGLNNVRLSPNVFTQESEIAAVVEALA